MIIRKWYSVKEFFPPDNEFRPVRCINRDECSDFYFMAYYEQSTGEWNFFDERYDNKMQVTHWCNPIKLKKEHRFKGK